MKLLCNLLPAIVLLMTTCLSSGQDLKNSLQNYFDDIRKGKYPLIPKAISEDRNEQTSLNMLEPFLTDSTEVIRGKAYEIACMICSGSADPAVRNRGVEILVNGGAGDENENTGLAFDLLTRFRKNDFNPSAQDSIRRYIRSRRAGTLYMDRALKLAGFLDLRDLIPDMLPWSRPGNPASVRWAALLGLARLGDPSAIADIMQRVRKFPLNDNVVYDIFPALVYTRQREPIALMVEALQSHEKNCMSADAEKEIAIPCGYRIMEQLAPVIAGYPVKLDDNGDLATEDYPTALVTVQEWFTSKKEYTILTDEY